MIIPDSANEKPQEVNVIAVGKGKRLEDGSVVALDVKPGDRILFGKYSGSEVRVEENDYLILREDEILGVIDDAGQQKKAA
jgi:chaperonin GroES